MCLVNSLLVSNYLPIIPMKTLMTESWSSLLLHHHHCLSLGHRCPLHVWCQRCSDGFGFNLTIQIMSTSSYSYLSLRSSGLMVVCQGLWLAISVLKCHLVVCHMEPQFSLRNLWRTPHHQFHWLYHLSFTPVLSSDANYHLYFQDLMQLQVLILIVQSRAAAHIGISP